MNDKKKWIGPCVVIEHRGKMVHYRYEDFKGQSAHILKVQKLEDGIDYEEINEEKDKDEVFTEDEDDEMRNYIIREKIKELEKKLTKNGVDKQAEEKEPKK